MYSRDGLMRLIEKHKWQIALSFVGNDATLQKILFDHVVIAGEIEHAVYLAKRLGMTEYQPDVSQIAAQQFAISKEGLEAKYLQLPLESSAVTFCDREEHIQETMAFFFDRQNREEKALQDSSVSASDFASTETVGLDVEWKPTTSKFATRAVASILQIATSTHVFLIDLLALHVRICYLHSSYMLALWDLRKCTTCLGVQDNDYLFDTFLHRLFSSEMYLKVGFGFDSDMKSTTK